MINLFQVFILSFTIHIKNADITYFSGEGIYSDRGECFYMGTSSTKFFSDFYKKEYKNSKVTSEYTCLSIDLVPGGK